MKILLFGEYSNVHWTLAQGLRSLGQEVTVVSNGDNWKDYRRDITLKRRSLGRVDTLRYMADLLRLLPSLKGYDVVQLINPTFLDLKAEHHGRVYRYLRQHNRSVFLGAYGMDHFWVKAGMDCKTFRYSDFNLGSEVRRSALNDVWIEDWLNGGKGRLNRMIADDCDGIVSGLYEYDASYRPYYNDKLRFIPFPINRSDITPIESHSDGKVRFFIGIQRSRSEYKGTDVMLRALERVERELPDRCTIVKVESVPYEEYQHLMNTSDVMLDQLYSYTPAMNALLGMAKGLVIVGGGEPENYEILHESELRPIVNVQPNEESVYEALRDLALHPERIPVLSRQSVEYIRKHHDHVEVARQYLDFWKSVISV